jgi:predicted ATPase
MIKTVQIKNFKSVVDLSLDLGTFNVFIGENGCGKTNILEAISFGAAASADRLDQEFFGGRGIRVTRPEFMFSAFTNGKKENSIGISFDIDKEWVYKYDIFNDPNNSKKWIDMYNDDARLAIKLRRISIEKAEKSKKEALENLISNAEISKYIVYSPEQSILRRFEESIRIYPLGVDGAGLFQFLKELILDKKKLKILKEIKENLLLLDWYEDFELPQGLMSNEYALQIKDRYLHEHLQYFDQKSTNEGFLYLLFYFTLFISKDTPAFFAIDNIDASLNPKLCMALTRNLAALAKKHKKQAIVTTHNPAILDGLNLKDDNQRLFVIRRNIDGHTKASRVEYKKESKIRLSETWTRGIIGGLPDNF